MTYRKSYWDRVFPHEKRHEKAIAKDPIAKKQYKRQMTAFKARKYLTGAGLGTVFGGAFGSMVSDTKKGRRIGAVLGAASGIAGAQREIWRGHRWAHNKAMQRVHPGIETRKREKRMGIREREELIDAIVESRLSDTKKAFKDWRKTARKGRKEYMGVMKSEGKRMASREKRLKTAAKKRTGKKRFYGDREYHKKATGIAMDYATSLDASMAKRKAANKRARKKLVKTALGRA